MPRISRVLSWLRDLKAPREDAWFSRKPLPPISFSKVTTVDKPPSNHEIPKNAFYLVVNQRRAKWALFQCPCGCKAIVTLSLQQVHKPHWTLKSKPRARPTLRPSIWRDTGCRIHFWIYDGRIYWCRDTGALSVFEIGRN